MLDDRVAEGPGPDGEHFSKHRFGAGAVSGYWSGVRARVAAAVVLAMVVAGGQGLAAFDASASPSPPPLPGKPGKIAAQQSGAVATGRALGLGSGQRLVVKDVTTDADGSTNVRYIRTFDGLPVIGGDLVSHRDKSGKIKGVSWNASHQVSVASTKPKISLVAATAVGTKKASLVQHTTEATTGQLVVYAGATSGRAPTKATGRTTSRLAYDVLTKGVRADQTPSRLHTIVDANAGTVLASWDEVETGTGSGIYSGSVTIGTTGSPGSYLMSDTSGNYTTDLGGVGDGSGTDITSVPGTTFTDADNVWGNGTIGDRASAGVDAQYGAEKTSDYFKNVLGRNGIWDNGVGARSRVHYGNGYANSYWDGTQMTYGDGIGNAHPLDELDVVGHEMTHGLTQNTAGLLDVGEAGGLNEATSDIFGTAVEWYADDPSEPPNYLIGELININGNGKPLRYMDQPSKDGVSADCWSPTVGTLDPHYSSGPLNHWFYLAAEGSGSKAINGVSYSSPTCNNSTVTPIGRDQAAKIWYRTLTTYLTSGSDYAAAREGAIQSAKDLYGATSTQCTGIAASFSAIGVPSGAETCGSAVPPSCTNLLTNPGFESGDTQWSATPNVIDQWGADGEPAHSGTWSAWLDGAIASNTDSVSQLVSIPAGSTATLSYYVHIDTNESSTTSPVDTLTVRAGSSVLQTLSNLNASDGYQYEKVDLSAYAGQTIRVSLTGVQAGSVATSFVLDDLSVSSPATTTVAAAPTAVSAVAGDAQAVVSWTAPASNGGCTITGYTVTAAPGGRTATSTGATTATVAGLANGMAYTFTVTATSAAGTSTASAASAPATPRTVPGPPTAVSAVAGNAQAVVSWTAPASNGGSGITGYTVTAAPGGRTATSTGATTATVAGLANGTAYTFTVTATSAAGTSTASAPTDAVTPQAAGFSGTTPARVLDTRIGLGAPAAKIGAGAAVTLTVPNLPSGTTAVALNVTVTNSSSGGFLTIYPGGQPRPGASNLNWVGGQTIPNMVEVLLGPGNTVTFFNAVGTVDVVADIMGYYAPGTGGGFTGNTPARVLDTRTGLGAPQAKLGPGATTTLTVPGLPAGTTAVALNVTATNAPAPGWLSVYPGGQTRPATSNLNWVAGQTIPNMVLVPLGPGNTVTFFNATGTVDVIADVLGYFQPGTGGGFTGMAPSRALDTRVGLGAPLAKLGPRAPLTLTVSGLPAGTSAVALNVTVTGPSAISYLSVYPGGQVQPAASNLNYVPGQTIPNMVLVPLGPGNTVTFYNAAGTTDVIADVMGYYS
jgi:Zn-dependent metalloprotease